MHRRLRYAPDARLLREGEGGRQLWIHASGNVVCGKLMEQNSNRITALHGNLKLEGTEEKCPRSSIAAPGVDQID